MISSKCPHHITEYNFRYQAPWIEKYEISGIEIRQKPTGVYNEAPFRKHFSFDKCKCVPYFTLFPIDRNIHSPKPPLKIELSKSIEQGQNNLHKCFNKRPNKFLEDLPHQYPVLFASLKGKRHMQTVRECERLRTTVQIDYGHVPEYPSGPYVDSASDQHKWHLVDPCVKIMPDCKGHISTTISDATKRDLVWKQLCSVRPQTGHFPEMLSNKFSGK